ncbi:Sulfurtransferase [Rhodovastum atsumiense]|uniref:Sulfurtransferase n=1 Tax=Rhodovastum atsumiense TaxID=504468 RepID=A0A5M6IN87_9PROT|nr:sulfurtransferase [Rhodovastum atsumiense]KAA5609722.1 sulfurtransferase [Rhodovastum atsumiense]CAH2604491.1 Sulfurtransferase [Rhodovastum atsumiense]
MPRRLVAVLLALALAGATLASARAADPLVAGSWLETRLSDGPGTGKRLVVLDVRPAAEHAAGHVPGAVSAEYGTAGWLARQPGGAAGALPPIEQIASTIGALGVGNDDHVVIVAEHFPMAARVYWTFKVLGHAEVSVLDGGWNAWRGPQERGPVQPQPAQFTPQYNPSLRASLTEVALAASSGAATLVDARPLAQWNGTARSPVVRTGGHLPGAVWVDQQATLAPDGRLQPAEHQAKLFSSLPAKPVITYCNTGTLAAGDWFVLSEVLGRPNTRLYDGSMSEWTADPSRPVIR